MEAFRIGNIFKRDAGFRQSRIGAPETFLAAEIRQARVNAHAGARGDDKAIGLSNQFCCTRDEGRGWHVSIG